MTAAITAVPTPFDGFESHLDECVDEASFLWLLRSRALTQPHFRPADLAELETRIDSQIRVLLQFPEPAWSACGNALRDGGAAEVFVAAVSAFRSLEVSRIQEAVEAGLASESGLDALVSALAWLPGRYCHDWIRKFLTSKEMAHKRLALGACSARGEDPCDYLTRILRRDDCRADEALYGEALHCVGVFKRRDLSSFLPEARDLDNAGTVFQACRSALLLGDQSVAGTLAGQALQPGPRQSAALMLAVRVLPAPEAKQWISQLLGRNDPDATRLSLSAVAALGDPEAIPWLLTCMKQTSLARAAGEAFFQITGIDLEEHGLHHHLPNLADTEHEDDPDTPVPPLDEDEHLPWPNSEKLAVFWETIKQRYTAGQRYLLGQPVAVEHCRRVLAGGPQRQRIAAALEWALRDPQQPWLSLERRQEAP